ncbi:MAG TPA: hypothetical protein VM681_10070 [Candidatus Thermoplasmatota archaeon]|nr:hypothetical protein [Candidatus Thermoplasmatota archaeon]
MGGKGLAIEKDDAFQRREWRAQRVGWAAMALVLALAAAGLFGTGPLSKASVEGQANGIVASLEHPRLTRHGVPEQVSIVVSSPSSEAPLRLRFEGEWIRSAKVESIAPPPAGGSVAAGGATYEWDVGSGGPWRVQFSVRAERPGHAAGAVAVEVGDRAGPRLPLEWFSWP